MGMGIGRRIKEMRLIRGMKQEELGKFVGATAEAIEFYETDYVFPSAIVLFNLITVLGCDANYLFQDVATMRMDVPGLAMEEYDMIQRYRTLDMYGKKNVNNILHNETERCSDMKM